MLHKYSILHIRSNPFKSISVNNQITISKYCGVELHFRGSASDPNRSQVTRIVERALAHAGSIVAADDVVYGLAPSDRLR